MRDEKVRLLKAIRPLTASDIVRPQFRGYRDNEGVAPTRRSRRSQPFDCIQIWRWSGVPLYIRAGKQLPVTSTDVMVELKRPPQMVFDDIVSGQANYVP